MKNAPNSYNAMAGFYRTAFAVSALIISASVAYAADPPVPRGNVSVTVNPTTGYYSTNNTTLRLPDGVRATPSAGASTVTKYAGGLKQSIPTGITIDAIKKSAPLPVSVRANTQSVKNAAKGFLKSPNSNFVFFAASSGLQTFLNGVDWVMTEGAAVKKRVSEPLGDIEPPSDYTSTVSAQYTPSTFTCSPSTADYAVVACTSIAPHTDGRPRYARSQCLKKRSSVFLTGSNSTTCYYGGSSAPLEQVKSIATVGHSEIDQIVDTSYNPDPSDWQSLTPHLQPDEIEITSAPTLKGEPITTTVYDADGVPHEIKETNIWYDFDIRDNPSSSPSLDLKMREETKTYNNGVLTGTTTTETTQPSVGVGVVGGGGQAPTVEIPTDCDFHPTLCKWLDWTKEEPEQPDDNLSNLLKEVPIASKTFTISGGAAACPAPLVLNLSQFGSREVSYQPLCDLASTMKFLYLALMSFAAAVLLHRSISRV